MTEKWIEKLAEQIVQKDGKIAEDEARAIRIAKKIEHEAPIFWRSVVDFLQADIEELIRIMAQDVTYREGPINYNFGNTSQISIEKAAYPWISFQATPEFAKATVRINYSTVNPKRSQHPVSLPVMPCRFELENEKVFMQLDGKSFHEPKEVSTYIIEKLFSIA